MHHEGISVLGLADCVLYHNIIQALCQRLEQLLIK